MCRHSEHDVEMDLAEMRVQVNWTLVLVDIGHESEDSIGVQIQLTRIIKPHESAVFL